VTAQESYWSDLRQRPTWLMRPRATAAIPPRRSRWQVAGVAWAGVVRRINTRANRPLGRDGRLREPRELGPREGQSTDGQTHIDRDATKREGQEATAGANNPGRIAGGMGTKRSAKHPRSSFARNQVMHCVRASVTWPIALSAHGNSA
jgi:hypothetical protein